ncbi:class I SAM-dependent rRNA methyltransferase [Brucepastera parasyntrophica]|uniref:class I SAM-dependent rRNA methyltransferase n=1 Tax=Brucepastera parasyntrophica TaxID=2880008 RepID=UPI00210F0F5E|nr:class I SAM-dependent rRNA methyltransferase [Brucepastera parasyntrophica]ULQ59697.1 class I SAM-dependent rRNA methyltransferase [Brucepastera parasyntrophica]
MNKIFLKSKEDARIRLGHPWIFDNEVERYQGDCKTGEPAEVFSKSGFFLGRGIINRNSKIIIRIFTRQREEPIDSLLFRKRIAAAAEMRELLFNQEDSYRLVFAEADFLPGLIIDRFADTGGRVFLSVQFLTFGIDLFRNEILSILNDSIRPDGIFERSDVHVRDLEGLPRQKGWIGHVHDPEITISENGILIRVNLETGQKTGYFLDQKKNRLAAAKYAAGKNVLDAFSHTGAFGLNAWKNGASSVVSVDISGEAVDVIGANIKLNSAGTDMQAVCADIFDLLKQYEKEGRSFDMIILDPPAFTKTAKMVDKAYGGYKEINLRAMKLLTPGGILVSCSCSHFFSEDLFYRMLQNAAMDSHKTVQILEQRGPSPDHPVLLGYPESDYLKCFIMRIW